MDNSGAMSKIEAILNVTEQSPGHFVGPVVSSTFERTFGGQVAAQTLVAALSTVPPEYVLHSLHGYFVGPGNPAVPTHFESVTPTEEVELCGHATISVFSTLRQLEIITIGKYIAKTLAGDLEIIVDENFIWMDMSAPRIEYIFNSNEIKEIYSAFNLDISQAPKNLIPKIVNTGLSDIIIPIDNKEVLDSFIMNKEKVIELSKKYKVVGAHLFTLDKNKKVTAFCRNIAPLVGIDEECATGTSNGALTHYLKDYDVISTQDINTFIQGESMGRASTIFSKYKEDDKTIQIGGNAVISFECKIYK